MVSNSLIYKMLQRAKVAYSRTLVKLCSAVLSGLKRIRERTVNNQSVMLTQCMDSHGRNAENPPHAVRHGRVVLLVV